MRRLIGLLGAWALLTYGLGRASHRPDRRIAALGARHGRRVRERPFVGVLLLRLSFLPYDPVNYMVGLLRVQPAPFLLANSVGSLPGVIAIVLAGNALGGLGRDVPHEMVGMTAVLLVVSVIGALALRGAKP
jgi:uncharacterized membrane protein YdjX (TVP38/TMEM64 family)